MTSAAIGYGSTYEVWDASLATPALVEIAEVVEITPGAESADRVEATHMGSTGRRREYIAGLIDSGEGSFVINWVPNDATDVLLRTLFESGNVVQHKITFPSGVSVSYDASIIGYEKAVPLDDKMSATITVAVSGAQTWAAAA
jgi:predicted secreted protein